MTDDQNEPMECDPGKSGEAMFKHREVAMGPRLSGEIPRNIGLMSGELARVLEDAERNRDRQRIDKLKDFPIAAAVYRMLIADFARMNALEFVGGMMAALEVGEEAGDFLFSLHDQLTKKTKTVVDHRKD